MTDTHDSEADAVAVDHAGDEGGDVGPDVAGEDAGGLVARRIRKVIEHGRADGD
jgi:hypothetical protein